MVLLKRLKLVNFRNYECEVIDFIEGINFISGENGQGKTNLLEAIFLLSTGRSFRTNRLCELIRHGSNHFLVEATFLRDCTEQKMKILYDGTKKQLTHNETNHQSFSHLLGLLPSSIYAPSDIALVMGSPQERRRFINFQIAQADPLYAYHLTRYAKSLQHRNSLLRKKISKTLDVWESQMALSAEYLIEKRSHTICQLSELGKMQHKRLAGHDMGFKVRYHPSYSGNLAHHWQATRDHDIQMGFTLHGPHRDDIHFHLESKPVKLYASEGQKRLFIAALRLAEWDALRENTQVFPILSIDDFAVHLDESKTKILHDEVKNRGQVFLTSPLSHFVDTKSIYIEAGKVTKPALPV